ncbi:glycosyltransferase family 2 protein [Modicisalibacter luteus]|uniref:Glycosyltransferase family 2 protein n=1 Tax=Modicisalibacter luteus TaxID=453962 RepID=A0ABV7LZG9_9GAMM|nr:glycosyltransferase family 2 protein [Halomonas lutea]
MCKVVAVILTYNRKDLLKCALDAVYSQTRPCDSVIVVDNASQDGTSQMLMESHYPGLIGYVLSNNIGASGGFNAGFRLAYQHGADFVWMMDDDVIPDPDALQQLLEAENFLNDKKVDHSFLLSTAFTENKDVTNTPVLSVLKNRIGYGNWPEMAMHGLIPVQRATFVSILVHRSVLEQHGLPIASMFIWGEDYEYTLRVSQTMPGFLVGKSRVQHVRQRSGTLNIHNEENPVRIKFYRHHVRNRIFITRKYFSKIKLLQVVWGDLKTSCNLLCKAEFAKSKVILQGVIESVGFNPRAETVSSPFETLKVSVSLIGNRSEHNVSIADVDSAVQPTNNYVQESYS